MPAAKKDVPAEAPSGPVESTRRPVGAPAKLAYIQTHIANVEKTGQNTHHNYAYMQEHGLIDLLRPYLRQLNCAVVVSPANRLEKAGNSVTLIGTIRFIDGDEHPYFLDTNGQPIPGPGGAALLNPNHFIEANFAGEGMDNQDKATNKAHTSFMKYALQKFFMVPTEHVDDSDSDDVKQAAAKATGREPVAPGVLDECLAFIKAEQEAGHLDRNKIVAKLSTLGAKKPADLDVKAMNVFRSWLDEQAKAASADG